MANETKQFEKLVIAGGSGFLGQSLLQELRGKYRQVVVLTRREPRGDGNVRFVHWDAKTPGAWCDALKGTDAVVNYVGRTVDCRKTAANKRAILESRVNSVMALAAAFEQIGHQPRVWVQSATAHIYGDTADEILDESSPIGTGFAPQVGVAWEAALAKAMDHLPTCRFVTLRISFVLGRDGGALKTLARLARFGLGGTVGHGRQYMSWIHEADLNALVVRAITDERMSGMYIATAPEPRTNRDFMRLLRKTVRRPWVPPTPALFVRIGAVFLRTDPELALLGRRIVPTRLMREGFTFEHPSLEDALKDLLTKRG